MNGTEASGGTEEEILGVVKNWYKMSSDTKVDTIGRLARWKIKSFGGAMPLSYGIPSKVSDPFKMGIWDWHLAVDRDAYNNQCASIKLYPDSSKVSKEQPPVAQFILRVTTYAPNPQQFISPIYEKLLQRRNDFTCPVSMRLPHCFTVDLEFLDLKISPQNGGEESSDDCATEHRSKKPKLNCLGRMLKESIHWDITINTSDGTLRAHKAVLSSSSPVFESMFKHDLIEKESSTIDIEDMTSESCMALLRYLYSCMEQEEFLKHRWALLRAANKYNIVVLIDACQESFLEDLNTTNVLERLQEAWEYQLEKLKKGCLTYLLDFGKIYDIRDEMKSFFTQTHNGLAAEIFEEVLDVFKQV